MSVQEQVLNGTFELDPENDPVICTTESGLEIKYAQAIDLGFGDRHTLSSIGGVAGSPLSGYAYLKLGKYNWIIIGYNNSSTTVNVNYNFDAAVAFSTYLANPDEYQSFAGSLETISPAAVAIANHANQENVWVNCVLSKVLDFSLAVSNTTELSSGELLLLCQTSTGSSQFGSKSYSSSLVLTAMRNLYNPSTSNGAEFTESEAKLIVSKTLSTYNSDSLTEYLFPLAGKVYSVSQNDNFQVATYLTTNAKRNFGADWWLRSYSTGDYICRVANGGYLNDMTYNVSMPIRPAMVIKI